MNKRPKQNRQTKQGNATRKRIMDYLRKHQVLISPVSMREIGEAVGLRLAAVSHHIEVLESQNVIRRPDPDNGSRTRHIEIVENQKEEEKEKSKS